jgi:hypothetical protein
MPKILYRQSTDTTVPYPRNDDLPVEGLDPDYLVLDVVEDPQPPYDPGTQYLSPLKVYDLENLEYRTEWTVEQIPPPAPVEGWDDFNATLLSDPLYHQAVGICQQNLPGAAPAPAIALTQVKTQGTASFALSFEPFCTGGEVSQETRDAWADLAVSYNLPAGFVAILRGS